MSQGDVTVKLVGDASDLEAVLKRIQDDIKEVGRVGASAGAQLADGVAPATNAAGRVGGAAQAAGAQLARMGQAGASAGNSIINAINGAGRSLEGMASVASEVRAAVYGIFIVSRGLDYLKNLTDIADSYTNLNSKLRNVTDGEAELTNVRTQLFDISQRTRTEMDATVTLYTRLERSTQGLNLGTQGTIDVTETLNKAFMLGGATADESRRAIIQLTQAFNLGILKGQDFNSVASQAPIVMQALRDSLGKTQGELKTMAAQGLLTAQVVVQALQQAAPKISAEFANVNITIEGGLIRVKNAFQQYIGQANEASGAGKQIVDSLTYLSTHIDSVVTALVTLAEALAFVYAGRTLQAPLTYAANVASSIVAIQNAAAAEKIAAEGSVAKAAADQISATATLEKTQAQVADVESIQLLIAQARNEEVAVLEMANITRNGAAAALADAQARAVQAEAFVKAAQAAGTQSFAMSQLAVATEEANTAAVDSVVAANSEAAAKVKVQAATNELLRLRLMEETALINEAYAMNAVVDAQLALTAANEAASAAEAELAGARTAGTLALGKLQDLGKQAFSLIGGWPTVVLAVVYALYKFIDATTDTSKNIDQLTQASDELRSHNVLLQDSFNGLITGTEAHTRTVRENAEATLAAAQAEQKMLISAHAVEAGLNPVSFVVYSLKVLDTQRKIDALQKALDVFDMTQFTTSVSNGIQTIQRMFGLASSVGMGITNETSAAMKKYAETVLSAAAADKVRLITMKDGNLAGLEAAAVFKFALAPLDDYRSGLSKLPPEILAATAQEAMYKDELDAASKAKKDSLQAARDAAKALKEQQTARAQLTTSEAQAATMLNTLNGTQSKALDIQNDYANDVAKINALYAKQLVDASKAGASQEEINKLETTHNALLDAALGKANARQVQLDIKESSDNRQILAIAKINDEIAKQEAIISGLDPSQVKYNTDLAAANQLLAQGVITYDDFIARQQKLKELQDKTQLASIVSQFGKPTEWETLIKNIDLVTAALAKATNPKDIAELTKSLGDLKQSYLDFAVKSMQTGLTSIQSMTKDGSEAFRIMQIAIDATTLANAIGIIINQGFGDPYTAFVRMAAMAAAVAKLGVDISGVGGTGIDPSSAAARQTTQGTGTVLGDATVQSQSIVNATKITADAVTTLVGINRGMLNALQALQAALAGASSMLAQGAGSAPFTGAQSNTSGLLGLDPIGSALTSDPIGGAIGKFLWGGSQKVIDQGIQIVGGSISNMINSVMVGAYQTIKTSGGIFGGGGTSDQVLGVSDEFTKQVQLIFGSIVDTVTSAATALGIPTAQINAAVAAFTVATTKISLEGLSGADQQKAIEAVFSSIFDGLAGAVVPFISEFQQVGEGLGETLVRVATEVQVTQQAFALLGIKVNETDPEKFAKIADGLVQAAGGLDSFMSELNSFVKDFAPQGAQISGQFDALKSALGSVGLTLPTTRDGMWKLMQSLDATTVEGQKQIAMLLSLTDASDAYYTALDAQKKQLLSDADLLYSMGVSGGSSDFGDQMAAIATQEQNATNAANELAEAQGQQGESAAQAAQINQWAADQIAQAVAQLKITIGDELKTLYGIGDGNVIGGTTSVTNAQVGSIQKVSKAASTMYADQLAALKKIQDYLDSMQYGALSGLSPEQQLEQSRQDFYDTQAKALAGDPVAMAALADAAQQYLQLSQGAYASGNDYNQIYDTVRAMLEQVEAQGTTVPNPGDGSTTTGSGGGGGSVSNQQQSDAQEQAINRRELAEQLVQHLADLSKAINVPIFDLINQLHVPLAKLVTDLGINLQNITGASVQALAQLATDLGVPLGDLVTQLGIGLPQLQAGILELTQSLGINLNDLTTQTVTQLAGLAQSLGTNLQTLEGSLGIDLGKLTDVNSPIFQALSAGISALPPDQAAALQPDLDAIKNATDAASANAAVAQLQHDIEANLPANLANALEPFFDNPNYQNDNPQLDALNAIQNSSQNTVGAINTQVGKSNDFLDAIHSNLKAQNVANHIPSFMVGTDYVPRDMLANIHRGEMVIDPVTSNLLRNYGIAVHAAPQQDNGTAKVIQDLLLEIKRLRADVAAASTANVQGQAATVATIGAEGTAARVQRATLHRDTKIVRSK